MGQKQRSIEVDHIGFLGKQDSRRHTERRADHAADHDLKPQADRLVPHDEAFRQPSRFIELDVDCVIAFGKFFKAH